MLPLIKFILTAVIWIIVILILVKKREIARKSTGKGGDENNRPDGSLFFTGDSSRVEPVSVISLWEKTANELYGTLIRPNENPSGNLTIAGTINGLPYRIELLMRDGKVFYSLTLPFEPKLRNQSTFVVRCVSQQAQIAKNSIMLLCPGTTPMPAVLKEMAAHAGRLLMTIPFEEESLDDKPESLFRRRQNIQAADAKIPIPVPETPEPVMIPRPEPVAVNAQPEPVIPGPVAVNAQPESEIPKPVAVDAQPTPATPETAVPETVTAEAEQMPPAPAEQVEEAKEESSGEEALSPESLAEVLFRSTLPGPAEKEYLASLTGRRVEWTGKVRMAYEISSDFVFGRVKGVKVQMDLCTVAGKYGRQTLRGTAVFPPETYAVFRTSSNKTIRFRGTILKLEAFSREVYLSEGELL